MKRLIKILSIILATILFTCCFVECKISCTLYDNVQYNMNQEFLKTNITRGAMKGALEAEYYSDPFSDSHKSSIDYFVKTQEEFDNIFETRFIKMDFNSEMLIVHIYTSYHAGTPVRTPKLKADGDSLIIRWEKTKSNKPNTSIPTHRAIAIKTAKANYNSIICK